MNSLFCKEPTKVISCYTTSTLCLKFEAQIFSPLYYFVHDLLIYKMSLCNVGVKPIDLLVSIADAMVECRR